MKTIFNVLSPLEINQIKEKLNESQYQLKEFLESNKDLSNKIYDCVHTEIPLGWQNEDLGTKEEWMSQKILPNFF